MDEAQLTCKMLMGESSRTKANRFAQVVLVAEALISERERVENHERDVAAKAKKEPQLLAKHQGTSETAS